jgi:hypothetical protein
MKYKAIDPNSIPAGVRFDCPRRNQGQIVVVSYGRFGYAQSQAPVEPVAGVGDPRSRRFESCPARRLLSSCWNLRVNVVVQHGMAGKGSARNLCSYCHSTKHPRTAGLI